MVHWTGLLLLAPAAARQCLRPGWGFQEPPASPGALSGSALPEGPVPVSTTVADAETCQEKCFATSSCSVFTFNTKTEKCLLQGDKAVPLLMPDAISGPKRCPTDALPQACQKTWVAAENAGATAKNNESNESTAEHAVSKAAMEKGEINGLSNLQKAQMSAIAVGRLAATKAALSGLSETEQLQAAARAAAARTTQHKDRQGMYAAGGVASESPTAKKDTATSRATYAMRMALDVVAKDGLHTNITEEQLQIASQLGALVVTMDGGTTEEVYSDTAHAMEQVAQDYRQSSEQQANWSAIAQATALDWYEESWTTDVSDLKFSMPEVWAAAWDSAEVSKQGGASLESQLLAAGQAARAKVASEEFDTLQQARQSSIAIAETARRLQAPAPLAAQVAAEGASELGLSLAMAHVEAERVRRLVEATAQAHHWDRTSIEVQEPRFSDVDLEEIWKAAMEAAQSRRSTGSLTEQLSAAAQAAAHICEQKGYNVQGQARMAALAAGEVARRLPGDQQLRISAAGFAAAEEAQSLGVSTASAAAESHLARQVAATSNAEEVRSLIRGATSNFTVAMLKVKDAQVAGVEADAAVVLGQDVQSVEQRSLIIGAGIGMAVLFVFMTACLGIFFAIKGRRKSRPVVEEASSGEETPLVTNERNPEKEQQAETKKEAAPTTGTPSPAKFQGSVQGVPQFQGVAAMASPQDWSRAQVSHGFHPGHMIHPAYPQQVVWR